MFTERANVDPIAPTQIDDNCYELRSTFDELIVKPRWPYRSVFISEPALRGLLDAKEELAANKIALVLTRGLENGDVILKKSHQIGRLLGSVIFRVLYPKRRGEVMEIFSPNGHDVSANCVDLAVLHGGIRIRLLPYGVFTSPALISRGYELNRCVLEQVWKSLRANGFVIHKNSVEAMRIHCEFIVPT